MSFMHRSFAAFALVGLAGCWGNYSESPPVHLQQNMDLQERGEAQERNQFFEDGRVMRTPPAGTVAVGFLKDDDHLWRGTNDQGKLAAKLPEGMVLDADLLARGEDRYNIYCAPCHGEQGRGDGMANRRVADGFAQAPANFHDEQYQPAPLGYFFKVGSEGYGVMKGYSAQIPDPKDRWAIAAWVRVLQVSHGAKQSDVAKQLAQAGRGQAPAPAKAPAPARVKKGAAK